MKRTKAEQVKRYLIFLVGLFVNSLGVSLITKGNLGTSPISSIPYVLFSFYFWERILRQNIYCRSRYLWHLATLLICL